MKLIDQNPYRIAGVLSSSSAREIEKQKSKIARFASVGKEVESDYDFPFMTELKRDEDNSNNAFSKIEQNKSKVNHALFWFVENTPVDGTALGYLKDGDQDKAIEIWKKTTEGKPVSSNNFSFYNNLGTLLLMKEDPDAVKEALRLKFELINSSHLNDFTALVADDNYKIDSKDQTQQTIEALIGELSAYPNFNGQELVGLFETCPDEVKQQVAKKFSEDPVHNIESKIEAAKDGRKKNPENAYQCGIELHESTKPDMQSLSQVMSSDSTEYKLISDKLAKEILQCGIDYFKAKEQSVTAASDAVQLIKYSKEIAISIQVIDRINDNLSAIQEFSAGAPEKEELEKIEQEYKEVTAALDNAVGKTGNLQHAVTLYKTCKPHLLVIKEKLGPENDTYLSLTTAMTQLCLNIVIDVVNQEQNKLSRDHSRLNSLSDAVNRSIQIMNTLVKWEMKPEASNRLSENKRIISNTKRQISSAKSSKAGNDAVNVIRIVIFVVAMLLFAARSCG